MIALGLIETVGYTTAVSAADAAVKAANVEIIGLEKVIGVNGYVGVTIQLTGDVAAVTSAVEAGKEQAEKIGEIISTEVIARAHSDVNEKLLSKFTLKNDSEPEKTKPKKRGKKAENENQEESGETVNAAKTTSSPKKQNKKNNDEKKA
ncbi:BMC domain-containing protein [Virgibacillus profundi]|uniref:BMC domain-containing protein n=1 Tax=Virgibacillus profundi TaxID=2024555 RepID=A0A2A2IER3_9BACI|nr:BMC domain-containing protein [Virgibacillus profundi]PAV29744.1 BMC domain-containing protein [Virgibacillus profundi]PXY53916.1 BMC domain-containing protein [Virgibacillus profundi]